MTARLRGWSKASGGGACDWTRARRARWRERAARAAGAESGIVGMMGNSVGVPAWSTASRPWESPEPPRHAALTVRVCRAVTADELAASSRGCGEGTPAPLTSAAALVILA